MILVDTSVWIDHLHATERRLVTLLDADEVGCHPMVIEEFALGSIDQRDVVLGLLATLRRFPVLHHDELLALVSGRRLWGHRLSAADAHLLGSVALSPGSLLWTRDKGLRTACQEVAVPLVDDP